MEEALAAAAAAALGIPPAATRGREGRREEGRTSTFGIPNSEQFQQPKTNIL